MEKKWSKIYHDMIYHGMNSLWNRKIRWTEIILQKIYGSFNIINQDINPDSDILE